jgi:hypothetical protein
MRRRKVLAEIAPLATPRRDERCETKAWPRGYVGICPHGHHSRADVFKQQLELAVDFGGIEPTFSLYRTLLHLAGDRE